VIVVHHHPRNTLCGVVVQAACCRCDAAAAAAPLAVQVPLDQILTSQKELLALQHIIQREAAAAHNRLQAIALGASGGGSAGAGAAAQPVLTDMEGGFGALFVCLFVAISS
jgi:hypothetical protein